MATSNFVLGTLNFDYKYVSEEFNSQKIIDLLDKSLSYNIKELDCAFYYNNSESILGNLNYNLDQFKISSKANPWFENDFKTNKFGQLNSLGIETQLSTSLSNLKIEKFDTYYLHAPDPETDILETIKSMDKLYRKEKFDRFGLSNYSYDEIQKIFRLCDSYCYNCPSVYQGMYNLYCRKIEEIQPILKDHNLEFYSYNPLAGGILTGKYSTNKSVQSRFYNNSIYENIFWNQDLISLVSEFGDQILDHSLRWLKYHAPISNKIILGVSNIEQLNSNMKILSKSKLSQTQLEKIDNFYEKSKQYAPSYYY